MHAVLQTLAVHALKAGTNSSGTWVVKSAAGAYRWERDYSAQTRYGESSKTFETVKAHQ